MKICNLVLTAYCTLAFSSCNRVAHSTAPNQIQNLTSPSGSYELRIPIEPNTTNPKYSGTGVWKVSIYSNSGSLEYKDEDSTMVGILNIYWGWDNKDQVWVYNSDDGMISKWHKQGKTWIKTNNAKGIPTWILPDYAK